MCLWLSSADSHPSALLEAQLGYLEMVTASWSPDFARGNVSLDQTSLSHYWGNAFLRINTPALTIFTFTRWEHISWSYYVTESLRTEPVSCEELFLQLRWLLICIYQWKYRRRLQRSVDPCLTPQGRFLFLCPVILNALIPWILKDAFPEETVDPW